jgi:hypothetical protein
MAGEQRSGSHSGPHLCRAGVGRIHRGSAKRISRIKWRDHTPRELVALMVVVISIVVALISWLVTHPEASNHHHGEPTVDSRRANR